MLKFNLFLPEPLLKWLRAYSKKTDTPVSELVRQALSEFKDRKEIK